MHIKPAIILGLFYGLRRSEICGLRWADISFESNTLLVKNTVVRQSTITEAERTKNKESHQTMYLVEGTIEYLKSLKSERKRTMKLCGVDFTENVHVCSWDDGSTMKPDYISKKFKSLLERNNLPIIRFHDLRHTAGSLLLDNGLSLKQIQGFMRHKQISTTLDIYAHLTLEGKKEASDLMGNVLSIEKSI